MLAVAATCLVAALMGAPTAGAASSSHAKASSAATTKAKAAVTKKALARRIAAVSRRTNAARRTLRTLGQTLAALQGTVNGLRTSGESTQGQVNGILAAVPQVLDALTQLRDGSLALKSGLETLAAKTTEGFGKVEEGIRKLATSTEYGVTSVYTFAPGDDPNADDPSGRSIAVPSADIPDSGTPATASGELPVAIVPSGVSEPNRLPPGSKVTLGSSIKSNERDGAATGDPAGYVGALLTVVCAGGGGSGGCGDEGTNAGQPEFEEGQLICVVGPTAISQIPLPTDPPTSVPQALMKIQEKVSWTDPSQPAFAPFNGTSLVNPLEGAQNAAGTGNASDGSCTLPSFGAYLVKLQTQFADIPTSASPAVDD